MIAAHSASRIIANKLNSASIDGTMSLNDALNEIKKSSTTKIISQPAIGFMRNEMSLADVLGHSLVDLSSDENLCSYDEETVWKSVSISAALLRRIIFNTSRVRSSYGQQSIHGNYIS